jgi:hypothetical protein
MNKIYSCKWSPCGGTRGFLQGVNLKYEILKDEGDVLK